jgi:pimeloyl-ACP methyl ester carboxylesterase
MGSTCRCALLFVLVAVLATPVFAVKPPCVNYVEPGPEFGPPHYYRVCMPDPAKANGALVVYAHGYVKPDAAIPVQIPEEQMVLDGVSVADLVTDLGFAFATTAYPKTGLAVKEGVEDVKLLVDSVKTRFGAPARVFLAGVSEGGLVTAKAVEKYGGTVFDGGLALCGPVGDFRKQINHYGDFRVVFDHFYPGVLPPTAVSIPEAVQANWDPAVIGAIKGAIAAKPANYAQLLSVTKVPANPVDPAQTAVDLLWYNVFATNEARAELGGQPFDNKPRLYLGSKEDFRLNLSVKRYDADPAAVAEMLANYQTTGKLSVPLVTMHTTGDPIVPYSHELLYGAKVLLRGSLGNYLHLPVVRYGHCAFTQNEVVLGFVLLVAMAGH